MAEALSRLMPNADGRLIPVIRYPTPSNAQAVYCQRFLQPFFQTWAALGLVGSFVDRGPILKNNSRAEACTKGTPLMHNEPAFAVD